VLQRLSQLDDGWNIGAIQAVTKREYADYQVDGQQYSLEAEPLIIMALLEYKKNLIRAAGYWYDFNLYK